MSRKWPLRHISIRVPWHDDCWKGTVCRHPEKNDSCLRLSRIAEHRASSERYQCESISARALTEVNEERWPSCVPERGMFMSPFEYTRIAEHPYCKNNPETHGHMAPTPVRYPPYSAGAVPFRWVFHELMERYGLEYGLDVDPDREPDLGFQTNWVQELHNQKALLDCFFNHLEPQKSLCFFYVKEVPFIEDSRRVIVGVGRVNHIGESIEYKYLRSGKLRSLLWERMVQHSIRPGFTNGFLLPYNDLIRYLEKNPEYNPAAATAFVHTDHFDEFSYASELVTNDAAIVAIQSCAGALAKAMDVLNGKWMAQIKWLNDRLGELWKMRGPCPGLGAALCAFGLELGMFIAREIETKVQANQDPWPFVDKAFRNPRAVLSAECASQIGSSIRIKWNSLSKERKALLTLLSRFNLNEDQAECLYIPEERKRIGIDCSDRDLLRNPYLAYEVTRLGPNPISVWTIDRGAFPEASVRKSHPLPEPSLVDSGSDARRVRAITVSLLEEAADNGHTLQRQEDIILGIRDLHIEPKCEVDGDLFKSISRSFAGAIEQGLLQDGNEFFQLARIAEIGSQIRSNIRKRRDGKRHHFTQDWKGLLDKALPSISDAPDIEQEKRARAEKAAALKELAESRISVLIGPAGTGKTTLLAVLCSQRAIAEGGVLLLAPTGKARVRMEQAVRQKGLNIKGYTLAQFLAKSGRYDSSTGRYQFSESPKESPAKTVIVDESSMLTEEMLAALIDSLRGVERLILVGDHRQLPPIGPGKPFVDIINELKPRNIFQIFPRVGPAYAELTVRRRQAGESRDDMALADWFSGVPLEPGEDEVLDRAFYGRSLANLSFKEWETSEQFEKLLSKTLIKELNLSGENDIQGFDEALGAEIINGYSYFNQNAARAVEDWQILTPVRKQAHGVNQINRSIHSKFRAQMIEFAQKKRNRKIPKPMGAEQIVYGDKVINTRNRSHKEVYPEDGALRYIANGEIGMVVGQFRTKNMTKPPWLLRAMFSSQIGYSYDFRERDFNEESEPSLELAYALTVHKAQGSEFNKVFMTFPNPCRLLSRELIYTALTRQRERIIILHQGTRSEILKYSADEYSEIARRLTNLFVAPRLIEHKKKFYDERLIHQTIRGDMVRSKSELTIADRLHSHGIDYIYEQALSLGGQTRYPDFTIEEAETGRQYYWEHCGMLLDPQYQKRWGRKLKWYRDNGILPYEEDGGKRGTLIVTQDSGDGGISSKQIEKIIKDILK